MGVANTTLDSGSNHSVRSVESTADENEVESTADQNESQVICESRAQHHSSQHQTARKHSSNQSRKLGRYSTIRIKACQYRRTRCETWCSCHCHKPRAFSTPQVLESLLGSLFFGYSGFLSPKAECNERLCRRQSIPTVTLNYYFPSWLLARVLQFRFHLSYMAGPEFLLRCPRVIPDNSPLLFQAVQGNLAKVQYLFEKGLGSPWDVAFSNGRSALQVSPQTLETLPLLTSTAQYAVNGGHFGLSKFLLDQGASPYAEDKNKSWGI